MTALQSVEYEIVRRDGSRVCETIDLPEQVDRELQQLMCMHGSTKCRPIAFYVNAERSESFDRELWLVVCARRTRGFLRRHWAMLAYVLALAAGVLASTHWAAP